MKNLIKSTNVSFCKDQKSASHNERHKLTLHLIKAKQHLTDGYDNLALKEIKNLENELKKFQSQRARRCKNSQPF